MDALKNLGRSDRPQGEFWLGGKHDEEGGLDESLGYGVVRLEQGQNKVTKMTASAAHIYGKKTASAESFTSFRHWSDYPGNMKQAADRARCRATDQCAGRTHSRWSMIFSDLPSPAEAFFAMPGACQGFAQAGNRFTLFGIML